MQVVADFHIHSRYSMATSRECVPEQLALWASYKGLTLLGTGDLTHPGWREELREKLVPAEPGLFLLRPEFALPGSKPVRFVLTGEISSIYKRGGKTRKVHNLVILPSFAVADALASRLEQVGNIHADGRPILGLDSYDLLKIVLDVEPEAIFVPAHIWTPHFSLFGAYSGFESIEECFAELTPAIFALETGLSSDPAMNWRWSALDRFTLISNSDAHSPKNLAREANLFDLPELSFANLRAALRQEMPGFLGTVEFFPEEGKYHYDGHRKCGVYWHPEETLVNQGICPQCGRQVTLGVYHRVLSLADRPSGFRPEQAKPYQCLVPLAQVIADTVGCGAQSQRVSRIYHDLVPSLGSELAILQAVPEAEIAARAGKQLAAAVMRLREGKVEIRPGYDGEYGAIRVLTGDLREEAPTLFPELLAQQAPCEEAKATRAGGKAEPKGLALQTLLNPVADPNTPALPELNQEQQTVVTAQGGPILVVAGPGTGKTRTLTYRIAHLIQKQGVAPETITATTFTNKAAAELRSRLEGMLGQTAKRIRIGTFHQICLELLTRHGDPGLMVIDEEQSDNILRQLAKKLQVKISPTRLNREISLLKSRGLSPDSPEVPPALQAIYAAYQQELKTQKLWDFDDLLNAGLAVATDKKFWTKQAPSFTHLLVDEFQDVNPVQYQLVRSWAQTGENLFVIGDPDQAIYGFRGAEPRFFSRLASDYPTAKRYSLTVNYRSTPAIVKGATAVMQASPCGTGLVLKAKREQGLPIRYFEVGSEISEGIQVAHAISELVGGATMLAAHGQGSSGLGLGAQRDYSFAEIAILTRTKQQIPLLEECLSKEGIPYQVVGRAAFWQQEAVRMAMLYLAENIEESKPVTELLGIWISTQGLQEDAALAQLIALAHPDEEIKTFLRRVRLGEEGDFLRLGRGKMPERVTLMTIHAAKGLEFPVVFLVGLEEGLLPLARPDREVDLEEERRLFYVGLTRAQEELILMAARQRTRQGKSQFGQPSRFLKLIPGDCLHTIHPETTWSKASKQMSLF